MVVAKFSVLATSCFKQLQGPHGKVAMQQTTLVTLYRSLLWSVGGHGRFSEPVAAALVDDPNWVLSDCRRFSASISETRQLVMSLGSFVTNMLQNLDASAVEHVMSDFVIIHVSCAVDISSTVAEQDQANQSDCALPPVFFHQLAMLSHSELCTMVGTHRERLVAFG